MNSRQREGLHADTDLAFAHGLKQGDRTAGARLISSQHKVVEYRAALEFEQAGFGPVDLAAGNIGRQKVRVNWMRWKSLE